jgi:hypothetical protein
MKAKWLVVALGSDKDINNLVYSIQENDRDVEVISLKEAAERLETRDESRQCIVPMGSIWFNSTLKQQCPNYVGGWHNEALFSCTSYYGYYGKYIAQQNHIMLTFGEIERRGQSLFDQFVNDRLFFRPNSGEKNFTGEVVEDKNFKTWCDRKFLWDNVKKDTLCVVSQPLNIKKELRLLVKDRKIVTGSTYRIDGNHIKEPLEEQDDKTAIIDFAEMVLNDGDHHPKLPPAHTIDIVLTDKGYSVMEVHCCCCCGRYAMDLRKLTKAISEAAEREFEQKL